MVRQRLDLNVKLLGSKQQPRPAAHSRPSRCRRGTPLHACRKFGFGHSKTDAFTTSGYNNWRHALVRNKGLARHEASREHMTSVALWQERIRREGTRTEVSTLVNEDQLERNRTYMTSIVDIIQYSCKPAPFPWLC